MTFKFCFVFVVFFGIILGSTSCKVSTQTLFGKQKVEVLGKIWTRDSSEIYSAHGFIYSIHRYIIPAATVTEGMRNICSSLLPCESARCIFACINAGSTSGHCVGGNLCWCTSGQCHDGRCFLSCISQCFSRGNWTGNVCQCWALLVWKTFQFTVVWNFIFNIADKFYFIFLHTTKYDFSLISSKQLFNLIPR